MARRPAMQSIPPNVDYEAPEMQTPMSKRSILFKRVRGSGSEADNGYPKNEVKEAKGILVQ
jgi:hypothetical protein